MIEKEIVFDYETNDIPMYVIRNDFNKTASYPSEIQTAINNLEKKIDHVYVLVNALSAGEFFGPNKNGDYFPESELIKHHKTYETLGFQYRKHDNKDPKKSFGKVIFAYYNPEMRRVEIIVELPIDKNKDIIDKIENGHPVFSSMGCRVPYDVCSICGNKAKTRAQYCDHLRLFMGRTFSDGRRVYAINVEPKFFDNSWVDKPAEATAGILAKIASTEEPKEAVIKKEIPIEIVDSKKDPKNLIICSQKKIPDDVLSKLAKYDNDELISTLLALRVVPTADEFNKLNITSYNANKPINIKIAEDLGNLLSNLVLTKPILISRFTKTADIVVNKISDCYKHYIDDFNRSKTNIIKLAYQNPWLLKVWIGTEMSDLEIQNQLIKNASAVKNIMIDAPESYLVEGKISINGLIPELNKFASENIFKILDENSLNKMYNSILDWEE